MKITNFKTFVFSTPWRNLTLFVIETDEGIEGYGEARIVGKTHTVLEYLEDVKRHIIGADVFDIEDLYKRFTLLDFGVSGEISMTGLALVEMACWDAIGKKANLPVYKLLGGKVNNKIKAYANGWYKVNRDPKEFNIEAQKVISAGYKALKFDPFGNGNLELSRAEFRKSIELIESVVDAATDDTEILIEMHGRFAPHQAVEIAKAIEKFNPAWIEEPCRPDDLDALEYVRDHTSIPIATGERLYSSKQFNPILWDFNMSFGSFRLTDASQLYYNGFDIAQAQQMDPLVHSNYISVAPRPLMRQLFSNDRYRKMYLAHIRTIMQENIHNQDYYSRSQALYTLIDTHVQNDTNKFYSYSDFINNLDNQVFLSTFNS